MPGTFIYILTQGLHTKNHHIDRRAPPSILNVLPGQPVELRVERRTEEDFVAMPLRGFAGAGAGSRLGGVVPEPAPPAQQQQSPGIPGSFPASPPAPAAAAAPRTRDPASVTPRFSVDQSKPTTSVQVRLADGTRFEPLPLE